MDLEQCFAPTERLRDIWEDLNNNDPFLYAEVMLVVPAEEFLKIQWDWEALWAFISADVQRKFLWLTDDTFIAVGHVSEMFEDDTPYDCLLSTSSTTATSGRAHRTLTLIKKMDADESTEAFSVFMRAIETNRNARILIEGDDNYPSKLPSGPRLAQFLRGRPMLQLQSLDFFNFSFTEERCRALATIQRTDLRITLDECELVPMDAQDIFIEWFRHNQIVTEIDNCAIEGSFYSALSGNNSINRFSFSATDRYDGQSFIALTEALPTNQGIEDLAFNHCDLSVEECSLLFRSLRTHPRILYLAIREFNHLSLSLSLTSSAESMSTVMDAILQMLRRNTTLIRIVLPRAFDEEEVYQNSILPRLEMNQTCFEVQRQAVKRADCTWSNTTRT
jgi:hypothetical protein